MALRFLHLADCHLDAPFYSFGDKAPQRQDDAMQSFQALINYAITESLDGILIAGDLFDSPYPSQEVLGQVTGTLQQALHASIPIICIPGTHDTSRYPNSVYHHPFWSDITLINTPNMSGYQLMVHDKRVSFYGMDYDPQETSTSWTTTELDPESDLHIALLHGSFKDNTEWDIQAKDMPFTKEDLQGSPFDYIALGHYHRQRAIKIDGHVKAAYSGSTEGKTWKETGPKGGLLVTIDENQHVSTEPVYTNTKTIIDRTVTCHHEPDISAITDLIVQSFGQEEDPSQTLLNLTLQGTTECIIDPEYITNHLQSTYFAVTTDNQTHVWDAQFVNRIRQEQTVRGYFVRQCDEHINNQSSDLMEEAMQCVLSEFQKQTT